MKNLKIVAGLLGIGIIVILLIYRVNAQESSSLSPTPSVSPSSSIPVIPDINPETLRDPAAFKLDQQIKQSTRLLFQALTSGDTSSISDQASQRKNLMKQAIQKYSYVFLGNALTSSQISSFDSQIQEQYFEEPLTLTRAELGVTHIDDFEKHENSRFDYSLQNLAEHKQFNFYPVGEFGGHISGTTLNVNGVALDEDITARVMNAPGGEGENNNDPVPTNIEILKEASPDALGPQRVAVILVKTKGATFTPYYTKEQIEEIIFRGDVQKFFKEASYGKVWLDEEKSKVYGWYEVEGLNIDRRDNIKDTSISEIINITDADINFAEFDRVMVGASIKENTRGGWGNIGKRTYSTGDGDLYLTFSFFGIGSNLSDTFAHELGHNFGLGHAKSWICDQPPLAGNCEEKDYGNKFDVMGDGYLHHFNGYFKEVLQWLNNPVIDITQSGTYHLNPIEIPQAVVARIKRSVASTFPIYYLETRLPVGFDNHKDTIDRIKGIHVNWRYDPLKTRLLSLNRVSETLEVLTREKSLRDEKAGITITNIDDNTVKVELEEPLCKSYDFNTEIEQIYAYPFNSYGELDLTCQDSQCILKRVRQEELLLTFVLGIRNNNSYACPVSTVRAFIDQAPWEKDPERSMNEILIPTGETRHFITSIIIPAHTQAGTYNVNVAADNVDTDSRIFNNGRILQIVDEFQTLEGDLTADGKVDIFDLVTVAKDFGKKGEGLEGDTDRDGDVDIFDLVLVAKNFGKSMSQ